MKTNDIESPKDYSCRRPDFRCDKVIKFTSNGHFMASVGGGEFFAICPLSKACDEIMVADVDVSSLDDVNFYNKDMQHVGVAE